MSDRWAKAAYEAYIGGLGQKMRTRPARIRPGYTRRTSPPGARLWEELPADEQDGWRAAVTAVISLL